MLNILLVIASGVLVAMTLLPLSRHPHWFIRGMDFPRLQLASLAVALILLQLIFLDLTDAQTCAVMATTSLCLVCQLWWILPYTRLWTVEVQKGKSIDSDREISILTSNVLTSNRDAQALIDLVNKLKPDVLVTLESDQWWESQLDSLEAEMPETMKCPLNNLYGMHVYSRLPLHEKEISFLVEDDVPSMHALLELPTGDRIRAHFLHPAPPSPTENQKSAERDAELVIVAQSVKDSDLPIIVTGDLNDVAWSRTTRLFRKISGLFDPRVGRGMFNTFNAQYPFLRWPLDHLFHSKHFMVDTIQRLPSIGSDHFPLFTRLAFTPAQKTVQDGLTANDDDEDFAASISCGEGVAKADVPKPGER